ncbi:MAG: hypothetical protein DHS20C13_01810 [Thermodesulfobacteriota bacterium]|nr:MAG: hypothetical protein DHS20C13_01810 [Thermodesulfobacteriota bacterium]
MNTKTLAVSLNAPKDKVFSYISDIENLPKWATNFCKELKKEGSDYKITSCDGEIYFRFDADKNTGVLDMKAGPEKGQMEAWPARVVGFYDDTSVFIVTAVQFPEVPDDVFDMQVNSTYEEFENIRQAVE